MQIRPHRFACALIWFCAVFAARGADESPAPVVWRWSELRTVGGERTEVWGAPEVVAGPEAKSVLRFNGTDAGLLVPQVPLAGWRTFTVEVLLKPAVGGEVEQRYLHFEDAAGQRGLLELRMNSPEAWSLDSFLRTEAMKQTLHDPARTHPAGRWTWVAMTYDGTRLASYVDGVKELEGPVTFGPLAEGKTSIGVRQTKKSWFKGEIAEVRFHPRALPAAELQREK